MGIEYLVYLLPYHPLIPDWEQHLQYHHTELLGSSGLCAQPTAVYFADPQLCCTAQITSSSLLMTRP
ncbi:hypothetical protein QTP86_019795 [Hemibagrus guttatus]|nr:hypothetical protein QTP86_019795 [Hemibagrus guttatus]